MKIENPEGDMDIETAIEMTKQAMAADKDGELINELFDSATKRVLDYMNKMEFFDKNKTWKAHIKVYIEWEDEEK